MPEDAPLTPDPTLARLGRFTPAAALDRDEVLFRAGRASARVGHAWKAAVALLVLTQVTTLTLWLLGPNPAQRTPVSTSDGAAVRPPLPAPPAPTHPVDSASCAALLRWDGDTLPPPPDTDPAEPSHPILTVADGYRERLLD